MILIWNHQDQEDRETKKEKCEASQTENKFP